MTNAILARLYNTFAGGKQNAENIWILPNFNTEAEP